MESEIHSTLLSLIAVPWYGYFLGKKNSGATALLDGGTFKENPMVIRFWHYKVLCEIETSLKLLNIKAKGIKNTKYF